MIHLASQAAAPLPGRSLLIYGAFAMPLAMAALPLYVHLPKLYGTDTGLGLGLLGLVLLGTRILDALSDPVIGWMVDSNPGVHRWVAIAAPVLAIGMACLLMPPQADAQRDAGAGGSSGAAALLAWLTVWLIVTYAAFSLASISYQVWGAQLSDDYDERTRVTAYRESLALIGVLMAAALPELSGGVRAQGLAAFAGVFVAVALLAALITVRFGPRPRLQPPPRRLPMGAALRRSMANSGFRWLLGAFVFSGIAAAIPSTLFLFFVEDVLRAPSLGGVFLLVYFASAALGMPLWVRMSRRYGKRVAWLVGMLCSVAAFVWAFALGPGDAVMFAVVCVISGMALGADLALPASMLADVIDDDPRGRGAAEGSYFGVWTFVTKANLALAAGIALPLVAWLGYRPGSADDTIGLAFVYCVVPCVLKLVAAAILRFGPRGSLRPSTATAS